MGFPMLGAKRWQLLRFKRIIHVSGGPRLAFEDVRWQQIPVVELPACSN